MTNTIELKELQQHINKACTRHQWSSTHFDELQGTTEKLALNSMDEIMNTKSKLRKVKQMSEEHPMEHEVEECATLMEKVKEFVDQVRT